MHQYIHLFDLDGTLVRGNSSFHFFLYLIRKRILPWTCFFRAMALFFAFRRKWISLSQFHREVFNIFLKGRRKVLFTDAVEPFLDEWLEKRVNVNVLKLGEGEKILLSSSPDFLVGPIARRLHISRWEASEYAEDGEGDFFEVSKIVDGEEKLRWACSIAQAKCICAYSDSDEDLPLLLWAGKVYVVRPNRRLLKIAREKGWQEILS